jgi:hypothetical protein
MADPFSLNLSSLRESIEKTKQLTKDSGEQILESSDNIPNPSAKALIETLKKENAEHALRAQEALPATRKAAEEGGFLYHFASKSVRESIEKQGIRPGQAQGGGKSFFYLDPYGKNISEFLNSQPNSMDLYRVPINEEILSQLQVDPKLSINDGVGKAVFLEGEIADRGLRAERISSNVRLAPGTGEIIFDLDEARVGSSSVDLQRLGAKADIGTVTRATATPKRSAMGARVSYSAAVETVGDNIEKVMGRSKATRGLLGAATEASAAVAGGVGQSNALRMAGAAASILRRRVI